MKTISVYCGSSSRVDTALLNTARRLGKLLAEHHIRLIYGAGAQGLMGELAKSCLSAGGYVVGVIPRFMYEQGWALKGLSELLVVETMHERKEKMAELADAFVALPGGCGTLEELFELITWKQLGLIKKPIVIVNTSNYYQDILSFFDQAVDKQFMTEKHLEIWELVATPEQVLTAIDDAEKRETDFRKSLEI